MKKAVIVGSHNGTRDQVPWDDPEAVFWVFNESASIGWPKRVDGVFQMHADAIWKNPLNRNDRHYPKWMKKNHHYPVWMLDEHPEVPSSVKFPLDEIIAKYLPKIYKGDEPVRYFTSSVAYALAYAIYAGYPRIELYGVEMSSDTEYRYQRDGVFFWLGIAAGLGIEVYIPYGSRLFTEPLYGYEGGAYLGREQLLKRKEILLDKKKGADARLAKASAMQEVAIELALEDSNGRPGNAAATTTKRYMQSVKDQSNALVEVGMFAGALAEIDRYLEKCAEMDRVSGEHMLARQEFELTGAQAQEHGEAVKQKLNTEGAAARDAWEALSNLVEADASMKKVDKASEKYGKAHQKYQNACLEFGHMEGVIRENMTLLEMVDEMIKAAGGAKAEEALLLDQEAKERLKRKELAHAG